MTTKNIDDLAAAAALAGADKAMLAQGDTQLRRTTLTAIRDWLAGTLAAVAGSGSAADLSTGTLADARLSSNVARRDEANAFGDNAISRFSAVTSVQTDDYTLQASPSYSAGNLELRRLSADRGAAAPASAPAWFDQIIDAVDAFGIDDAGFGGARAPCFTVRIVAVRGQAG